MTDEAEEMQFSEIESARADSRHEKSWNQHGPIQIFRVWDKQRGCYMERMCITEFGEPLEGWWNSEGEMLYKLAGPADHYLVEYWVWREDESNTGLYEGDIINNSKDDGPVLVRFDTEYMMYMGRSWYMDVDADGEQIMVTQNDCLFNVLDDWGGDWSIVGNIHETPDLLPVFATLEKRDDIDV